VGAAGTARDAVDGGADGGPPPRLVREWTLCAIAAAAARFVPVPLLDDQVKDRATQLAVLRTLRAHGRRYPSTAVEPLYEGAEGWGGGLLREAARLPVKLALYPVRKYVAVFGAVKGVPTDVMTVLLLSRSVHRSLDAGRLLGPDLAGAAEPSRTERRALQAEALEIRRAFDLALDGMDLALLSGAISDALAQGGLATRSAVGYARRLLRRDRADEADLPAESGIEAGADRVEQALRRPELARLVAEFDAGFDAALAAGPR
jgi:hypothetical protein